MAKNKTQGYVAFLTPEGKYESGLPWETGKNLFLAFFQTWALVTFRPKKAFAPPLPAKMLRPFLYSLLVLISFFFLVQLTVGVSYSKASTLVNILGWLYLILSMTTVAAFCILLASVLLMLFLLLFRQNAGFRFIFRLVCYTSSVLAFALIPLFYYHLETFAPHSIWPTNDFAAFTSFIIIPFMGDYLPYAFAAYILTMGLAVGNNISPAKAFLPVAITVAIPLAIKIFLVN